MTEAVVIKVALLVLVGAVTLLAAILAVVFGSRRHEFGDDIPDVLKDCWWFWSRGVAGVVVAVCLAVGVWRVVCVLAGVA